MLRIIVGTTLDTQPAVVKSADTTVLSVLEEYQSATGFDIYSGSWTITGMAVRGDDLNKTFRELGYTDGDIHLMNIVNAKNA